MPLIQAGYGRSFAWTDDEFTTTADGKEFIQAGIGMQVNGPRHAFVLQLSYRQQQIQSTYIEWGWGWPSGEVEELRKHRSVVVSVGMSF